MSTHSGPNIIEDGLVLCLDPANEKSFRGEPTTNEFVQITWGGDGGPTVATVTDQSLMYKGYFTQSIIGGTSGNCYLHSADISTSRTSDVWTFSCYLRREDKQPITSMNVYMYYPSSDGSAAATIEDVGDGWYRLSRTRTGSVNYIGLAGFTGLVSGVKYYLSGAQLEKKAYPTAYVNTNTTRGTTVATGGGWADLSGNNSDGNVPNGLTYSSEEGGSLAFNGSAIWSNPISTKSIVNDFTHSVWAKRDGNSTSGIGGIFGNHYHPELSGAGLFFRNASTYVDMSAGNGSSRPSHRVNLPRLNTEWNNYCISYSGTTYNFFFNGELLDSREAVVVQSINSNRFAIGRWAASYGSYYLNGKISACLSYNKALSDNEVYKNFTALRNRYGI